MKCPACDVALVMSERQGIEIDYCPQCRGVWLDRGELDKILEKSAATTHGGYKDGQIYHADPGRREHYDYKRRKRKSFLEELFD